MSYIYFVQMNIPAEYDAELNRIYDTEHVPMLSKVPGVNKVTRYRLEQSNDTRMQKYLAIYEIEAPAVVESREWDTASAWGDWATKIRPHTTSRHHSFFKKIGEFGPGRAQTPYIYLVQMDIPASWEAEFTRIYNAEHAPLLSQVPGCGKGTRYRLEKSNDSRMQEYMVIYELDSPAVTETKAWGEAGAFGDWATKIRPHTTSRHHTFFKTI